MQLQTGPGMRAALLCGVLAMSAGGAACNRAAEETPATAERQAVSPEQATAAPMTVSGCLRAGEAENTFVLTAARAASGEQTATYHLVGAEGMNLAEHIGRQVEVQGVLKAQQQVATRTTTDPAPNTTGTSGTPAVSTSTNLTVRRLDVRQIRALAGECPS